MRTTQQLRSDFALYLEEIDRCLGAKCYWALVHVLLALPDVCASLEADLSSTSPKVGDRYVLERLQTNGWTLGGETSGHILCLDKHTTGDGLISALQVLTAVVRSGRSLSQLLEGVTLFPQTLINVRLNGQDWKAASAAPLAAAEQALQGRGRVVLRPSGTEPVVRVMVEADDAALAHFVERRSVGAATEEHDMRALQLPAEPPALDEVRRVVRIFRELRNGSTVDGRTQLKKPSGSLSTAEAISVIANGMALAGHFGDGTLGADELASGLIGSVIKDRVSDATVWQEYLETVLKERAEWRDLYRACLEVSGD